MGSSISIWCINLPVFYFLGWFLCNIFKNMAVLHYSDCMDFELWVDADSIPRNLRAIVLRAAARTGMPTFFVADRDLADVRQFIQDDTCRLRQVLKGAGETDKAVIRACRSRISMVVVQSGQNSADDYIVENSSQLSLCITHDIPLASRMLAKGSYAIDDRGESYTSKDISARLGDRLVNQKLREMGFFAEQQGKMKGSVSKSFADNLDRTLTSMFRQDIRQNP